MTDFDPGIARLFRELADGARWLDACDPFGHSAAMERERREQERARWSVPWVPHLTFLCRDCSVEGCSDRYHEEGEGCDFGRPQDVTITHDQSVEWEIRTLHGVDVDGNPVTERLLSPKEIA